MFSLLLMNTNLRHFSLSQRPLNFRDDLVLPDYQKLEDDAIRRTHHR